jgi:hypothetical protein
VSDANDAVRPVAKIGRGVESLSSPEIGKMGFIFPLPSLFSSLPCRANRESIPSKIDLVISFSLTTYAVTVSCLPA